MTNRVIRSQAILNWGSWGIEDVKTGAPWRGCMQSPPPHLSLHTAVYPRSKLVANATHADKGGGGTRANGEGGGGGHAKRSSAEQEEGGCACEHRLQRTTLFRCAGKWELPVHVANRRRQREVACIKRGRHGNGGGLSSEATKMREVR